MRPAFQQASYDREGRPAEERFARFLRSRGYSFVWNNESAEAKEIDFTVNAPIYCDFEVEHKHPKYASFFSEGVDFVAEKVEKYSKFNPAHPCYYVLEMDTFFVFAGMVTIWHFGEEVTKDTTRRKNDRFYRLDQKYTYRVDYPV